MSAHAAYPMRVEAELDPHLSRWLWLVKWFLAILHYIVLAFLWVGFFVMSVVAFFAILFTGRYPRPIFEFNVGVLRWTWRVSYYSYGALATDRYPPFTLAEVPDYPTRLQIEYPGQLSRGLVLVKWWLLAIPHYLIIGFFIGGAYVAFRDGYFATSGLIEICALIAAVILLFTGRYPHAMFDLLLGLNRWVLRVAAYAGLMTDAYPPFRLDMGGTEPGGTGTLQVDGSQPPASPASPAAGTGATKWGAGSVITVIAGSLIALFAFGMLAGGGVLLWADRTQRDDAGFVSTPSQSFATDHHALVVEEIDIRGEGPDVFYPSQILGDARVTVRPAGNEEVFVGVARTGRVEEYLGGVAYGEVTDVMNDRVVEHGGSTPSGTPGEQSLWEHSTEGAGTQTLSWELDNGRWSLVVMNADASPGLDVRAEAGAELPALLWVAIGLLVAGFIIGAVAVAMIVAANHAARRNAAA